MKDLAALVAPSALKLGGVSTVVLAWPEGFAAGELGKKDRAAAKDLMGALIREVGLEKGDIGRIDVRDTFSLVELAPAVAERVVGGLAGVTIKGRRALARFDREDSRKGAGDPRARNRLDPLAGGTALRGE